MDRMPKSKDVRDALAVIAQDEPEKAAALCEMIIDREESRRPHNLIRSPLAIMLAVSAVAIGLMLLAINSDAVGPTTLFVLKIVLALPIFAVGSWYAFGRTDP